MGLGLKLVFIGDMIQPTTGIDTGQLEVTSQGTLLSPRDITFVTHLRHTTLESSGINTPLSHFHLSFISDKVYTKHSRHIATQALT